ncbi:MAG: BBE domain-containing protein [Actinomycetota bacterium]
MWEDLEHPLEVEWARRLFNALAPASTGKAYVNFMSQDEQARVPAAYCEAKLARLVALKDRVDADYVFRLNHNISPSRSATKDAD